ncbi:hypothetical protein BKA70DRAFT_1224922 [Coprinopsis sp. MPI-PUGE-AT-0042]|nr:hypothetical protein BKA70DRAFT_1224922 [Coprinopsis sp. MPI-PUGE-AT-0042]
MDVVAMAMNDEGWKVGQRLGGEGRRSDNDATGWQTVTPAKDPTFLSPMRREKVRVEQTIQARRFVYPLPHAAFAPLNFLLLQESRLPSPFPVCHGCSSLMDVFVYATQQGSNLHQLVDSQYVTGETCYDVVYLDYRVSTNGSKGSRSNPGTSNGLARFHYRSRTMVLGPQIRLKYHMTKELCLQRIWPLKFSNIRPALNETEQLDPTLRPPP